MTSSAYGADVAWDYSQQGNNWATLEDDNGNIAYPLCNGDHQSPINIIREKTILYEGNDMLDFSMAYCDSLPGYFKNNGHTIQFDPDLNNDTIHDPPQSSTYITGGPLGAAKYLFWQFHFHWGSDSTDGSEHLVDGVRNAAEVHLVHVREDYKDDISGALDDPEGLAVLAIFIEGGAAETNDTCWFDPIAYAAEAIADANNFTTKPRCTGIDLNQMVQKINPGYKADFNYWHFMGSLTTPPCSEAAHFIIAERALAITDAQVITCLAENLGFFDKSFSRWKHFLL